MSAVCSCCNAEEEGLDLIKPYKSADLPSNSLAVGVSSAAVGPHTHDNIYMITPS